MDTGYVCRLKGNGEFAVVLEGTIPLENTYDVVIYCGERRAGVFTINFDRETYHIIHLPFAKDLSIRLVRRSGREADLLVKVYKKCLWFWRRVK